MKTNLGYHNTNCYPPQDPISGKDERGFDKAYWLVYYSVQVPPYVQRITMRKWVFSFMEEDVDVDHDSRVPRVGSKRSKKTKSQLSKKRSQWRRGCKITMPRGGMYWKIPPIPPPLDREICRSRFCTTRSKRLPRAEPEGYFEKSTC